MWVLPGPHGAVGRPDSGGSNDDKDVASHSAHLDGGWHTPVCSAFHTCKIAVKTKLMLLYGLDACLKRKLSGPGWRDANFQLDWMVSDLQETDASDHGGDG